LTIDYHAVQTYDYNLPEELIAQEGKEVRHQSRLLYLEKETGKIEHYQFFEIEKFYRKGDVLVVNESKVFPARLLGNKRSGAKVEVFLLQQREDGSWKALAKPGRKLPVGAEVIFPQGVTATILERFSDGSRHIEFRGTDDIFAYLFRVGHTPLPPYIRRSASEADKERYQNVFAKNLGSVAAPTAGFHFSEELLEKLEAKGVERVALTLHVGLGTFRPVSANDVRNHQMHSEYFEVSEKAAAILASARQEGRRITAVGTTVVRTLESVYQHHGQICAACGWTDIFIYPPYKFHSFDRLITNFHLPKSTLLMLVSAFGGYEPVMNAYREAVEKRYRFFSYGDAMFIG